MHDRRFVPFSLLLAAALLLLPVASHPQSFNGSVSGTVADPSGSPVPGADLVLKNTATGVELQRISEADGGYAFRNLLPGSYELRASLAGFQTYQTAVEVRVNSDVRVDVKLTLGAMTEQVEVVGAASDFSYSGQREDGIAPDTLAQLPLMFQSGPRSSASFTVLMPGVTTGGTGNPYDARINGGMGLGDEAVVDGASMQQGYLSQSGMVSIYQDFPYSPDMVSEVKVVTSSYAPEYGSTTSGQITAITKSGTDKFHGAVFEYFQHDSLNANQWGASEKSPLKKHNFGANVGGPMKIPGLWSNSVKTYFYVNVEGYRQEGGANRPTLSIPSLKERAGDFSDWRDTDGNLIPIYDPATTRIVDGGGRPRSLPGERHPRQPDQPHGPGVAAVPAPAHERRAAQQLPGADRDPGHRSWATATTSSGGSTRTSARRTTSTSLSGTSGPRRSSTPRCPTSWPTRTSPTPRTPRSTGSTGTTRSAPTS